MKKSQKKSAKKEILLKDKEEAWRIPPCAGIPTYRSEVDPYCTAAQIKRYNEEKRQRAKEMAKNDKQPMHWVEATLQATTSVDNQPDLKDKIFGKGVKSVPEVEILQKIIVRENLLSELNRLLKTQNDVVSCLSEVSELLKAIRYQSLDIIEDISRWKQIQPTPRPFMFKGFNYLIKIKGDLDFLDSYEEITFHFCFEFQSNPLAYRGGGNIITGYEYTDSQYRQGLIDSYYQASDGAYVDGIDILRLHQAERVIQDEFNRLSKEKETANVITYNETAEATTGESFESDGQEYTPTGNKKKSKTKKVKKKLGTKFSSRKVRQERIVTLYEEAGELKAMLSHIEDQIALLVKKDEEAKARKSFLHDRLAEAQNLGRETAAQHIHAEISVTVTRIQEVNNEIKDRQRESYFIGLERRRKLGVMQQLKDELETEKKRAVLKKQIEARIKKEGLLSALKSYNKESTAQEMLLINQEMTEQMERAISPPQSPPRSRSSSPRKSRGNSPQAKSENRISATNSGDHVENNGIMTSQSDSALLSQQTSNDMKYRNNEEYTLEQLKEEFEGDEEMMEESEEELGNSEDEVEGGWEKNYQDNNNGLNRHITDTKENTEDVNSNSNTDGLMNFDSTESYKKYLLNETPAEGHLPSAGFNNSLVDSNFKLSTAPIAKSVTFEELGTLSRVPSTIEPEPIDVPAQPQYEQVDTSDNEDSLKYQEKTNEDCNEDTLTETQSPSNKIESTKKEDKDGKFSLIYSPGEEAATTEDGKVQNNTLSTVDQQDDEGNDTKQEDCSIIKSTENEGNNVEISTSFIQSSRPHNDMYISDDDQSPEKRHPNQQQNLDQQDPFFLSPPSTAGYLNNSSRYKSPNKSTGEYSTDELVFPLDQLEYSSNSVNLHKVEEVDDVSVYSNKEGQLPAGSAFAVVKNIKKSKDITSS